MIATDDITCAKLHFFSHLLHTYDTYTGCFQTYIHTILRMSLACSEQYEVESRVLIDTTRLRPMSQNIVDEHHKCSAWLIAQTHERFINYFWAWYVGGRPSKIYVAPWQAVGSIGVSDFVVRPLYRMFLMLEAIVILFVDFQLSLAPVWNHLTHTARFTGSLFCQELLSCLNRLKHS